MLNMVLHIITPLFEGHKTLLQIESTLVYEYQYLETLFVMYSN